MGPWLASHGFVVIGIETNSRNDFDTARGTQLLAALDYLTQQSPVRNRVDPNRLAVAGHSMGGGGALSAAIRRPSLKAAVGARAVLAVVEPGQRPGAHDGLRGQSGHRGHPVLRSPASTTACRPRRRACTWRSPAGITGSWSDGRTR